MTEFDEVSRAIGKLEGRMEEQGKSLVSIEAKVDRIDGHLTNQRIKTGILAAAVSFIVSGVKGLIHPS